MSHVTRILVTGGDGILAQALRPYFPLADYYSKSECDVTNAGQVRAAFNHTKPELVIHCAATTAHDADPMAYVAVNIQGTCNVVAQSRRCGARLLYLSTDYLGAPREGDKVAPVNAYAATKYAGEISVCVQQPGANALAIRGSWYSTLDWTYAATDAYTSKLPVDKAAYYIAALAVSSAQGVVNIGGQRRSLYEIALEFNEQVVPVKREQLGLPYQIPADCSLDTTKLNRLMAA
jgi:dTDP-4-dehydrorhamnose reductase